MNRHQARELAQELLDMQSGSVEDARNMIEAPLTPAEQAQVHNALDDLADEIENERQAEARYER